MNPKPIEPYNLRVGESTPSTFYQTLAESTTTIIERAFSCHGPLLKHYATHENLQHNDALLDILITGVLWNTYADRQIPNLAAKGQILNSLYDLRKLHPQFKTRVDNLRGQLAFKWLAAYQTKPLKYSISTLDNLSSYLRATTEYSEEIRRMKVVKRFIQSQTKAEQVKIMEKITALAADFQVMASRQLNPYTKSVQQFWKQQSAKYAHKENYFFCGRQPVEYHLNMVGAELMNRALKREFNQTREQVVLVPTCMSQGKHCNARVENGDLTCQNCSCHCHVSILKKQLENDNLRFVLIPHSSKFSKWLRPWANQKRTGLIGIACVLNLLKGGFEMKRLGIPSQCVFLDFPGCKKHWKSGVPTQLDRIQLRKTMQTETANC